MINFMPQKRKGAAFPDNVQRHLQVALEAVSDVASSILHIVSISSNDLHVQVEQFVLSVTRVKSLLDTARTVEDIRVVFDELLKLTQSKPKELFGDFVLVSEQNAMLTSLDAALVAVESALKILDKD